MKRLFALSVAVISLMFAGQACATASYEAEAYLKVGFSQLPIEFTQPSSHDLDGTGYHDEHFLGTWNSSGPDADSLWYSVTAHVEGYAGNATGTLDGTSEAWAGFAWGLDFNVPAGIVYTPITLTYLDSNISTDIVSSSWEYASAEASLKMYLDDTAIWFDDGTYTTPGNLSAGTHTISFVAYAAGTAEANYPCTVPEPATMLLLGLGLIGLAGVRRKIKK